jgi:hypothetical protein
MARTRKPKLTPAPPPSEPVTELTMLTPEEAAGMEPRDEEPQWGKPEPPKPVATKPTPAPAPKPVAPKAVTLPSTFKMPRRALTMGAFFEQLRKYTAADEQIAWLRYNDKLVVRYLIRLGFEPVKWILPKGLPPYKPFLMTRHGKTVALKPGHAPAELLAEARRLYLFLEGGADHMSKEKREKVFQHMIEDMAPEEVAVLLAIKDKKLDRYVPKQVVADAFPGIFDSPFVYRFLRR